MKKNKIIKEINSFKAFSEGTGGILGRGIELVDHGIKNVTEKFYYETANSTRWIEFDCLSCGNTIQTGITIGGYKDEKFGSLYCDLSWRYKFTEEELCFWSNRMSFTVSQVKDKDKFYACIKEPYESIAKMLLKKCKHCKEEYLIFFTTDGKTMWDTQDIVTIHSILQVRLTDDYEEKHFSAPIQ